MTTEKLMALETGTISRVLTPQLILASSSPRRRTLLDQIGVSYRTVEVHVEEKPHRGEPAEQYVLRMAIEKACAGRVAGHGNGSIPILAADTVIVIAGNILGKPRDRADALAMLGRLAGRTHQVMTAVALVSHTSMTRLSVSRVTMGPLSPQECEAYWQTGEGHDKAGSYAIQGRGASLIERIEGSYSGVMGLPLFETREMLESCDIKLF